jgi:G:T-mismatch repair DNA endonuclease (very short patch repair protein)
MKRAWDTRGRVPHTIVEFKCDGCGINVKRDLNASGLKAFQIEKYHFCSLLCNRQHLTRKALEITAEMDVRNCLICSKEIVRPKAYFDYHKDYRGFFCCSNHQRQFLSLYGLPESAIKTIKEFRSTQVFAERPNNKEKLLIPMLEPMGFSYCGNGTFRVGKINPDFINERKKIVAEHYGCWWHRCPTCYPDREQEIQLTARVAYRDSVYVSAGYKHIVIWEHELNDPAWQSNLLAKIGKFLA